MSNIRFGLLVYFAVLTACAAVGVVLAAGGDLADAFRLFESVDLALVCGGGLYAAVRMLERRDLVPVAGLIAAVEIVAFVLVVYELWAGRPGGSGRWSATLIALAIAGLIVAALRSMIDSADALVRAAFLGSSLCVLVAAGVTIHAIWATPSELGGGDEKTALTFWVMTAYGFLLTPALRRFRRAADGPADAAGPSGTI